MYNIQFVVIAMIFSAIIIAILTLKVSISLPRRGAQWFHVDQRPLSPYRVVVVSAAILIFAITVSNDLRMELPRFNLPSIGGIDIPALTNNNQSTTEAEEAIVVDSSPLPLSATPPPAQDEENPITEEDSATTNGESESASPTDDSESTEEEDSSTPRGGRQGREPTWARDPIL